MPIIDKHTLPKKSDRKIKNQYHPLYKMGCSNKKNFERVEEILECVYVDVINGVSKSDIYFKLKNAEYPNMKKGLGDSSCYDYYQAVMQRLAFDADENESEMKNKLYSQYYQLYNEAIQSGNNMQAKQILDSIMKMGQFDKPKPTVQISPEQNDNGKISITFGFESAD